MADAKASIYVMMDAFIISPGLPFCYNPITRGQFREVKLLYRLSGEKDWHIVEGIHIPQDTTREKYLFIIPPSLVEGTMEIIFVYVFDGVKRSRAGENKIVIQSF